MAILFFLLVGVLIGTLFITLTKYSSLKSDYERLTQDFRSLERQLRAAQNPVPSLSMSTPAPNQDEKAMDGLRVAVQANLMSENEARDLAQKLGLGVFTLQKVGGGGSATGDDICPECGQAFDVQDDYVCQSCRAKMDAS